MSITTYTELKTAVADWLNRDDLTDARITDFIQIAENRIFHELRIPPMETTAVLTVNATGKVALPANYLEARDVIYNDRQLERVSLAQILSQTQAQGTPLWFARDTVALRFWPNLLEDDTVTLVYYGEPTKLSATNATNDVFDMAPELYLYGALIAAGTYVGAPPERMSLWSESFNDAMQRLLGHARQAEASGSTLTTQSGY